jgi:hypothetical protein
MRIVTISIPNSETVGQQPESTGSGIHQPTIDNDNDWKNEDVPTELRATWPEKEQSQKPGKRERIPRTLEDLDQDPEARGLGIDSSLPD